MTDTQQQNNTAFSDFAGRHIDTNNKLRDTAEAAGQTFAGSETALYNIVGAALHISGQSVGNYVKGLGKDGYLTEALIAEFEKFIK